MSYYRKLLFRILHRMSGREYGEQALRDAAAVYHETVRQGWEEIAAVEPIRDLAAFRRHFFAPEDGFEYLVVDESPRRVEVHVTRCHLAEELRQQGCAGIGERFFCDADRVRAATFNPRLGLERPKLLMRGDDRCVFIITEG